MNSRKRKSSERLFIRITVDEKIEMALAARAAGKTMSDFVKEAIKEKISRGAEG